MSENRKTLTITFNKGLDKASLPFEASPARALDELNYVYRDGRVQKRYGLNELLNIPTTYYVAIGFDGESTGEYKTNTTEWNGIWRFKAEDGKYHIVAHIGKLLYEIEEEDGYWEATPIVANSTVSTLNGNTYYSCYEFESYKSTAVVGAKCLYFLGGNQFMRLRYTASGNTVLASVAEDSGTYVPTTTISITYEDAVASGRQSYDLVNLMTRFRKNTLLSGVGKDEDSNILTEYYEYTLDAPLICKPGSESVDMASFAITLREREV